MEQREEWGTSAGFILAAVGSAIGLLVGIAVSLKRWPDGMLDTEIIDLTDIALPDAEEARR
jgi:hypothetical protein